MSKLDGKVALITGAGRGIGQAAALKLAAEGARVVVNDLDAGPAHETVERIRAAGGAAVAHAGSVTDPAFAPAFVANAMATYGAIDIIVNNAGFTWDAVIQKMTDAQFSVMLSVHLEAPFRLLRAAFEPIKALRAADKAAGREVFRKVVNVSSTSGLYGNAGQSNYAAAKAGLVGLTRSLAKEWGRHLVNVNCVAFGMIDTRLTQVRAPGQAVIDVDGQEIDVGIPAQVHAFAPALIPLGRAGTPQEAAGAIYLLCTPEADYVSGQILVCSGGLLL